jgi:hypothetical protein
MRPFEAVSIDEFLSQAGDHGPCVGIHVGTPAALIPPAGVEVRPVEGADTRTRGSLFDAFAHAWQFPPRFIGRNNANAFDDWMRDLDNLTNVYLTKPPALGYLTELTNAHLILTEEPEQFSSFANSIPFYRDYYRDDLDPPAAFGLLLSAPPPQLDEVRERWLAVGVEVATVTV